jgi:UDP-N-acetylmuramate dehydrogenase
LGGPADVWLPVEDVDELVTAVKLARQHQIPVFMLGGGANLLITDGGIRGLVIENRSNRIDFPPEAERSPGETVTLTVESGVNLPNLARRCARKGFSGLEWAVGVPGTIGGAVVNNAGAYDSDMARSLTQVELLSPNGERVWEPVEWFEYGYRMSKLKKQKSAWIVLKAELQMTIAPADEVENTINDFNTRRKASQPPGATLGSMFKNPPDDYAGRLIEAAGLKGYCVGQAQISPIHANFFQNLGDATAADVLSLIEAARGAVKEKFDIELELEIEVVGES